MARGHQKAQSQARNQEKQKALKNKQGHSKDDQKKAALQALKLQCTVCRGLMPDPKTYRQHFENKHPSATMPEELKDVACWDDSSTGGFGGLLHRDDSKLLSQPFPSLLSTFKKLLYVPFPYNSLSQIKLILVVPNIDFNILLSGLSPLECELVRDPSLNYTR